MTIALMNYDFPLKSSIEIDPAIGDKCVVNNISNGKYFRLGINEARFLASLDGTKSLAQLKQLPFEPFTADQIERLIHWFCEVDLLETSEEAPTTKIAWFTNLWRYVVGINKLRIHLVDPDEFLNRHASIVDIFFAKKANLFYFFMLLFPVLFSLWNPELIKEKLGSYHFSLSLADGVILYLALFILTVLHEFSHAITCKHFGGKVNRIGVMFMYFMPTMYCDVSDSWRFKAVNHKILVTIAGVFMQLIIGNIVFCLWLIKGEDIFMHFMVMNLISIFVNLIPFVKLDGYWILVHLLDEPNLRQKSFETIKERFFRLISTKKHNDVESKPIILLFGLCAICFTPCFWLLSVSGIYRISSNISSIFGSVVLCICLLITAIRLIRFLKDTVVN